jgi:hypothetical protein
MSTSDSARSAPQAQRLARAALGILLVAGAGGAVVVGVARENAPSSSSGTAASDPAPAEVVTVYYFHGERRCRTCLAIESATERVVRGRFADELAAGSLRYEAIDFDEPAHRHFKEDYDLAFGTVVVQGFGGARTWRNLTEVWTLVDDPAKFEAYLVENIQPMLARAA